MYEYEIDRAFRESESKTSWGFTNTHAHTRHWDTQILILKRQWKSFIFRRCHSPVEKRASLLLEMSVENSLSLSYFKFTLHSSVKKCANVCV